LGGRPNWTDTVATEGAVPLVNKPLTRGNFCRLPGKFFRPVDASAGRADALASGATREGRYGRAAAGDYGSDDSDDIGSGTPR
jgi:hypothetical protein